MCPRYHFESTKKSFEPAELTVGGTGSQLYAQRMGLTSEAVKKQKTHVDLSQIKIEESSFLRIMMKESTRTFYVYQNFITWTWLNYAYWHSEHYGVYARRAGGATCAVPK